MSLLGQPEAPGKINRAVLTQDKYWWDIKGKRYDVATMDHERAFHVIMFCMGRFELQDKQTRESPLIQALYEKVIDQIEKGHMYEDLCR